MRDYLLDLLAHCPPSLDVFKVVGTTDETSVVGVLADRSVIISAKFKKPVPEFNGVFGLTNLPKLKTILSFDEYSENAKIELMTKNDSPFGIHFENQKGTFCNDYRFMDKQVVETKVRNFVYNGSGWNVEFEPSVVGIQQFKRQASANSEEPQFSVKTINNDLKVHFGTPANHNGNFVFASNIEGTLTKNWQWPVKQFLSILDMNGTKKIKINDQGAAVIEVDSGLIIYQFFLPAYSK